MTRHIQIEHSFGPIEGHLKPTMAFGVLEFREFSFIRLKPYHCKISEFPPASAVDPPLRPDINKSERIIDERTKGA